MSNHQGRCAQCGEVVTSCRSHRRYCSERCRMQAKRKREREKAGIVTPTSCKACKGTISFARPNKLYCSRECADAEFYRRSQEKRAARRKAEAQGLKCRQCGKGYQPSYRKQGPTPAYCSVTCRRKWAMGRYYERERTKPDRLRAHGPTGPRRQAVSKGCANCAHWSAKGCALEAFRTCNPGVASRHWQPKEAHSA